MKPIFVRRNKFAEQLGVSKTTLWRMERRGEIPPSKALSSRIVGWWQNDIDEWLLGKEK